MPESLISTTGVRAVSAGFRALGLDAGSIESEAGLSPDVIADPDGLVPVSRYYAMWEAAQRRWGAPGLGLHAGAAVPLGVYEVLDYVFLSASTVGEALAAFNAFFGLVTRTARYGVAEEHGTFAWTMSWTIPPRGVMFHLRDYGLAAMARRVREASGHGPLRAEIDEPALAPAEDYRRVLGAPAVLGAPRSALVYSALAWRAPHLRRDAGLHRTLRRHAEMLLERSSRVAGATLRERVRALLLEPSAGRPGMVEVASDLAMSARSLQRGLQREGTTFAALVDEIRRGLAQEYLSDPALGTGEIAYLLGFSQPSAFTRAFRRWTGLSPRAFRARRTAAG